MSDNTQLNVGASGDVIRSIDRTTAKTQVIALDAGGEAGPESLVTSANPLPVGKTGSYFVKSTANSSSAQLAPGAQFVGTIEAIPTALELSLNIPTDQPLTVTVNGYQSTSASSIISSQTMYVQAGVGLNVVMEVNQNYTNVVVTNTGTATTTLLAIDAQYGDIPPQTQNGNLPVAIQEVGGVKVTAAGILVNAGPVGSSALTPEYTVEQTAQASMSADGALFHALAGDPGGDFAGMTLLDMLVDPSSGLAMSVNVTTPIAKQDASSAFILSDAPAPLIYGGGVGSTFIIDTQGYQSLGITTQAAAGTVTTSNDQITWTALSGTPLAIGALTTSVAASTGYVFPCIARYIKITLTAQGRFTAFLRSSPWVSGYQSSPTMTIGTFSPTAAMNVSQIGGVAAVAGSTTGYMPTFLSASSGTNNATLGQLIVTSATAVATQIKASAGRLLMLNFTQASSTVAAFIHMQNASAATTATASTHTYYIPAVAGEYTIYIPDTGLYFSTGIAFTYSGAITSADASALSSTPSFAVNYSYI